MTVRAAVQMSRGYSLCRIVLSLDTAGKIPLSAIGGWTWAIAYNTERRRTCTHSNVPSEQNAATRVDVELSVWLRELEAMS